MSALPGCMSVHCMQVVLAEAIRRHQPLLLMIVSHHVSAGNCPLDEQPMLLTAEPSSTSILIDF